MTLTTQAVIFAAQAHDGALRKGGDLPYIVHPMETAVIAASITSDEEVIAAAALHDVIEDCGVTAGELCARFGERVARLVLAETHINEGDPRLTWDERKRETVERLRRAGREESIIALADKLSNMRAIRRDYEREGEGMFLRFHQHDMRRHAWYYRSCAALLEGELGGTQAWQELDHLIGSVFAGVPGAELDGEEEERAV